MSKSLVAAQNAHIDRFASALKSSREEFRAYVAEFGLSDEKVSQSMGYAEALAIAEANKHDEQMNTIDRVFDRISALHQD